MWEILQVRTCLNLNWTWTYGPVQGPDICLNQTIGPVPGSQKSSENRTELDFGNTTTHLFSAVVHCIGSGLRILSFRASYRLMSKNYRCVHNNCSRLGETRIQQRNDCKTAIILYLLSFKGTAINEIWASTMSPMQKFWGVHCFHTFQSCLCQCRNLCSSMCISYLLLLLKAFSYMW